MNFHSEPEMAIELVRNEISAVGNLRADALTMIDKHEKLASDYREKISGYDEAIRRLESDLAKLGEKANG